MKSCGEPLSINDCSLLSLLYFMMRSININLSDGGFRLLRFVLTWLDMVKIVKRTLFKGIIYLKDVLATANVQKRQSFCEKESGTRDYCRAV